MKTQQTDPRRVLGQSSPFQSLSKILSICVWCISRLVFRKIWMSSHEYFHQLLHWKSFCSQKNWSLRVLSLKTCLSWECPSNGLQVPLHQTWVSVWWFLGRFPREGHQSPGFVDLFLLLEKSGQRSVSVAKEVRESTERSNCESCLDETHLLEVSQEHSVVSVFPGILRRVHQSPG